MKVICPKCKTVLELPDDACKNGARLICDNCSARLVYNNGRIVEEEKAKPSRITIPTDDNRPSDNEFKGGRSGWSYCFAATAVVVAIGGILHHESHLFALFNAITITLIGLSMSRQWHDFPPGGKWNRNDKGPVNFATILAVILLILGGVLRAGAIHC